MRDKTKRRSYCLTDEILLATPILGLPMVATLERGFEKVQCFKYGNNNRFSEFFGNFS